MPSFKAYSSTLPLPLSTRDSLTRIEEQGKKGYSFHPSPSPSDCEPSNTLKIWINMKKIQAEIWQLQQVEKGWSDRRTDLKRARRKKNIPRGKNKKVKETEKALSLWRNLGGVLLQVNIKFYGAFDRGKRYRYYFNFFSST